MSKNTKANPFDMSNVVAENKAESRRLDFTPVLIDKANQRAQELMLNLSKEKPELIELSTRMLHDLNPTDLVELLDQYFGAETIGTDAQILDGCDEEQLSRLLESRRSDRSKAKAKKPAENAVVCKTYISAMYAELLIRVKTGKPYSGSSNGSLTEIDENDQDQIKRRVASLQSKKSRLGKIAKYDAEAQAELDQVVAEIARLNALRPTVRTVTKTSIKSGDIDTIRQALAEVDTSNLSDEDAEKLQALMAKLG